MSVVVPKAPGLGALLLGSLQDRREVLRSAPSTCAVRCLPDEQWELTADPGVAAAEFAVPVDDDPVGRAMGPFLRPAAAFVADKRRAGHDVLVHCFAGVSRSATVCVAALHFEGLELAAAFSAVAAARPVVSPNPAFVDALCALDAAQAPELRRVVSEHNDALLSLDGEGDVAWLPPPPQVDVATYLELLPGLLPGCQETDADADALAKYIAAAQANPPA